MKRSRRTFPVILPLCLLAFVVSVSNLHGQDEPRHAATSEAQPQQHSESEAAAAHGEEPHEAEGEDEHGEFKHSASVKFLAEKTGLSLNGAYWLSVVLNFAVIAGAILWFSKKNLPGIFRNRTAFIQKAMEEARKASEDANRRLAEIEARLSKLGAEIAEMRAAADKEAAGEEARIKAAAEDEARKLVESSEQEIAAAAKAARRELTAYAAELAVSLAKKQIQVDTATDQALVRNFAQQLSADDGAPRKSGR
jgi:F-type H+-transporting ATPase subunit b